MEVCGGGCWLGGDGDSWIAEQGRHTENKPCSETSYHSTLVLLNAYYAECSFIVQFCIAVEMVYYIILLNRIFMI